MKELKEELDAMKNRVNIAERNVTSMDAQRKSAVADKASLQKEVKWYCHLPVWYWWCLYSFELEHFEVCYGKLPLCNHLPRWVYARKVPMLICLC